MAAIDRAVGAGGRAASRGGTALCLLGLALVAASCGRDAAQRLEQERDIAAQRRLYAELSAPLAGGHDALRAALADAAGEPVVFALAPDGARRRDRAASADELGDEALAVFFVVGTGDARRAVLVDPRAFALLPLAAGEVAVVRALPAGGWRADHGLDVHRFDFRIAADGAVTAAGHRRLTADGDASTPVAWPEREAVVYVAGGDAARLMRVPLAGGAAAPLLDPSFGASRAPRRAADGALVFAGGPRGGERLWRLAADAPAPEPWDPPAAADGGLVLSFDAGADGVARPRLRAAERYDLAALAALVELRQPAIVRRRALLAAALIEARQMRLAHLPTLTAGIWYVPKHGLAVGPGFSGDVLAEGLARGAIGLVQPLLDWSRVDALGAAAVARARIAADALEAEVEIRLGETLEHAWAARAWAEVQRDDAAAVAAGDRAVRDAEARRRIAGDAGEVELLVAHRAVAEASARRDAHARELALHLDELRRLAALPADAVLDPDAFPAAPVEDRAFADLRRLAELNQPRLRAARHAVSEAFQIGRAGGLYRPGATLGGEYGQTRRDTGSAVDDYVQLSLTGSLPVAWFADRDLADRRADRALAALAAAEDEEATRLARELEEAYVAYWRGRGDAAVAAAGAAEAAERSRQARLRAERGEPDPERALGAAQIAAIERAGLAAGQDAAAARAAAAVRLARLWRLAGLARAAVRPVAPPATAAAPAQDPPPCD